MKVRKMESLTNSLHRLKVESSKRNAEVSFYKEQWERAKQHIEEIREERKKQAREE